MCACRKALQLSEEVSLEIRVEQQLSKVICSFSLKFLHKATSHFKHSNLFIGSIPKTDKLVLTRGMIVPFCKFCPPSLW